MKVLLVNPNRYKSPPVPPIGLEYIAASLEGAGHEVMIADLCFSEDPIEELDAGVAAFGPDVAGITVRNVDTVLFETNEFFLDGIRDIVERLKRQWGLTVIAGGTGITAAPEGVIEYIGADYAICGPGEDVINDLLSKMEKGEHPERIQRRKYRYDISCPRRFSGIDYGRYFGNGGVAGFETHTGCGSSCVYCLEANTSVSFRPVTEVISEIRGLVAAGYKRFHLCDPEFNEDLDYCLQFCSALRDAQLGIDWALYMKPANYNKKFFRLMRESGVSLITLTVDSWKKCPLYYADIEKIVFSAKSAGLKIAVDFLAGFPYETEETLLFYLDTFRRLQPDSVGINTHIRLYRTLQIKEIIMKDVELRKNLSGHIEDRTFIKPVFYSHIDISRLKELIGDDKMFRIEGLQKGVNYQRV